MVANSDNGAPANAASTTKAAVLQLANTNTTANGKPKEKRRNNEKRKEKSRDAARCRRSRETEIFSELAEVLPLTQDVVSQLDKASIMRMAIAYLKVRGMLTLFPKIQELCEQAKTEATEEKEQSGVPKTEDSAKVDLLNCLESSELIKQALDGFLLVLSNDGDISYVSENITEYLGIAKIDILGQQIWEYSHQCDHAELKEALNIKQNGLAEKVKDEHLLKEGLSTDHRDFFVRLKCTLTSRGRSINIKSASYKVIHITGHLVVDATGNRVLIAVGRPVPHPSNIEIPLGSTTFLTKHTLDMKFTYVDDKMLSLLDYNPEDLLDKSLYDCYHGADSDNLMSTFKILLSKGQGETCRYRFLGKYGGYCWVVTQATIVYDKLKPQSVVCVNYVISNLDHNNEICSLAQYEASQRKQEEISVENSKNNETDNIHCDEEKPKLVEINASLEQEPLITSTTNIVATCNNQDIQVNKNISSSSTSTNFKNNTNNNKISTNDEEAVSGGNSESSGKIFDVINTTNNSISVIKLENQPSTLTPTPAKATPTSTTTTVDKKQQQQLEQEEKDKQQQYQQCANTRSNVVVSEREHSLSPLRRKLQSNCQIGTIYKPIFHQHQQQTTNYTRNTEEKRPKSVTASVFRTKPTFITNTTKNFINSIHNNVNNNNKNTPNNFQLSLPQLTVASRVPSTDSSVLTPKLQSPCNTTNNSSKPENTIARTKTTTAVLFSQHKQQLQQPHQRQNPSVQQQDMNKGFLTFAEDGTELAMLKEEPDDLTHLAPTAAVDACLPLDDTTPLFGEMFVGLMGSYGSLLPDDISSLDSTTSTAATAIATARATGTATVAGRRTATAAAVADGTSVSTGGMGVIAATISPASNSNGNGNNAADLTVSTVDTSSKTSGNSNSINNGCHIDPFINYREESNDTNCSQHLLSPSVTSKSPDGSSLPSLCSPHSLSQEDEFAFMTMTVDDDIDLEMRAPYIPMNEQDDLPLLTADDLMWCGSNTFITEDLNMHKEADAAMQQLQLPQPHDTCDSQQRNMLGYAHTQFGQLQLNQQHFSNSLCSSPASTVSSLSPSPENHPTQQHSHLHQQQLQHQQQQQHQHQHQHQHDNATTVFGTDSSELAALLCGAGTGTLTILGGSGCAINDDNDNSSGIGSIGDAALSPLRLQQSPQPHYVALGSVADFRLRQLQQQFQEHEQQQQQQQQRQQHHLVGLSMDNKKEKYESSLTSSLCDSIEDAFENVYCKDSTNLDCWNELLQMNVNETSLSAASPTPATATATTAKTSILTSQQLEELNQQQQRQQQQQQQDCKPLAQLQQEQPHDQNIILNALPLITIQNGKSIMLQPEQQGAVAGELILKDELLSCKGNKIATIKILNGSSAASLAAIGSGSATGTTSGGATIQIVENKAQQPKRSQATPKVAILQQQQQQQHGSKRHLSNVTAATQVDKKRLKSTNGTAPATAATASAVITSETVGLLATPQLLQQLMAAPALNAKNQQPPLEPLSAKQPQRKLNAAALRWPNASGNGGRIKTGDTVNIGCQQQVHTQPQQQQSNSVLKNLLISGCDVSAGYCILPMRPKKLAKA